jgi:hypothetical protein
VGRKKERKKIKGKKRITKKRRKKKYFEVN